MNRSEPSTDSAGNAGVDGWGTAASEVVLEAPEEQSSGWGDGGGMHWDGAGWDLDGDQDGEKTQANSNSAWSIKSSTFAHLLGPSVDVGLSHTLGGMRKITQVFRPGEGPPPACEYSEFDRLVYERMGRVVMSPSTGW